jgi:hypothetical protein
MAESIGAAGCGLSYIYRLTGGLVALLLSKTCLPSCEEPPFLARKANMASPERRQLARYNVRTPLRFRAINLGADNSEHFTEALNVSRGGFFFASSAPLQIGVPIEATLRMPVEVTGGKPEETRCNARVVHVRNEPYGDGRIGFGAAIEKFHAASLERHLA